MTLIDRCAEKVDVAVVGAGPAGLAAGLYAARAGLRTVVFGDRYQSQLARAEIVENYPSQIKPLNGLELIELFARHAARFDADFDDEEIRQIRREGDVFHLFSSGGGCVPAYAIVLAMGTKRKQLGLAGETEYYGRGVAYCTICDGPLFRHMPVIVIGAGEEGAAAAMRMASIASTVGLIVPQLASPLEEALLAQLAGFANVIVTQGAQIREIVGDSKSVTGVQVSIDGQMETHPAQGVFLEMGLLPASTLAGELGVALDKDQFVIAGVNQATNVPGVYAAGDITGHRARQTVISAGEGAIAAVSAVDYIKSHGLGGARKELRLIQWGTKSPSAATPAKLPEEEESTPSPIVESIPTMNELKEYVSSELAYHAGYQSYQPDTSILDEVRRATPRARVTVIAASWCPDCRRQVPKMARIAEQLPGWEFRVFPRESEEARWLDVRAIPTIVVFDAEAGIELGRIVEEPSAGSIEADLLEITRTKDDPFTDV